MVRDGGRVQGHEVTKYGRVTGVLQYGCGVKGRPSLPCLCSRLSLPQVFIYLATTITDHHHHHINCYYYYHIKSPCTSRSLREVASSSSGQQAREQKRSAGRLLGDNDFDY